MIEQITVYAVYTATSIGLTVWVANTLHKNGRVFLLETFRGDEERADAVNHLLKVGFYLVNIGFVLLFLRVGDKPTDPVGAIEFCATKLGFVTLVLGAMHFFNMYNFDKMRKKGRLAAATPLAHAGR